MGRCAFCGADVGDPRLIGRRDSCPACERDLHCCLQCRFFDPHAHNQCREPQADYVKEKDAGNFCGYFALLGQRRGKMVEEVKTTAKQALDELFKK